MIMNITNCTRLRRIVEVLKAFLESWIQEYHVLLFAKDTVLAFASEKSRADVTDQIIANLNEEN